MPARNLALVLLIFHVAPCFSQGVQNEHLCDGFVLKKKDVVSLDIIGDNRDELVEIVAVDQRAEETIGAAVVGRYRHPTLKRWQYFRIDRFTVGGEGADTLLDSYLPGTPGVSAVQIDVNLFAVVDDAEGSPSRTTLIEVLADLRKRHESEDVEGGSVFFEADLLIRRRDYLRSRQLWARSPKMIETGCLDCSNMLDECLCRIRNIKVGENENLSKIKIAVVDSGLLNRESAKMNSVEMNIFSSVGWADSANTYNPLALVKCSEPCEAVFDDGNHGTAVAGVAAGVVTGVAPGATIIPVRIWDNSCAWTQGIAKGIAHASAVEAEIIVLPWLLDVASEAVRVALKNASESLLVVSAGDDDVSVKIDEYLIYPPRWKADLPNMVVVGGLDEEDKWYSFYSKNLVDLGAPFNRCWTWLASGHTGTEVGTSLSAGYVGGAAARVWAALEAHGKKPTPTSVKDAILKNVRSLRDLSNCCGQGNCGALDVSRALGGPEMCVVPSKPSGSCR